MKNPLERTYKVALYQYLASGYGGGVMVFDRGDHDKPMSDYARISQVVEVSFAGLSNDEAIQNAVAALNEAERQAVNELNRRITDIRTRKAKLLALTHDSGGATVPGEQRDSAGQRQGAANATDPYTGAPVDGGSASEHHNANT